MKIEILGILKTLSFMFGLLAIVMLLAEILVIGAIGLNLMGFIRMLCWALIGFCGFKFSTAFDWYVDKKVNEKLWR